MTLKADKRIRDSYEERPPDGEVTYVAFRKWLAEASLLDVGRVEYAALFAAWAAGGRYVRALDRKSATRVSLGRDPNTEHPCTGRDGCWCEFCQGA